MPRNQEEQFEQDRLGNLNRRLDDIRSQDGMHEDNGILTISESEDEGVGEGATISAEEAVYVLPDTVKRAYLSELEVQNSSFETDTDADPEETEDLEVTYTITEVELDEDGEVTDSVQRSLERTVDANGDESEEYTGQEFSSDGIAISVETEGVSSDANEIELEVDVAMSVHADSPEEYEPNAEQTATPG